MSEPQFCPIVSWIKLVGAKLKSVHPPIGGCKSTRYPSWGTHGIDHLAWVVDTLAARVLTLNSLARFWDSSPTRQRGSTWRNHKKSGPVPRWRVGLRVPADSQNHAKPFRDI